MAYTYSVGEEIKVEIRAVTKGKVTKIVGQQMNGSSLYEVELADGRCYLVRDDTEQQPEPHQRYSPHAILPL
jgi:hypothetical protein